jgi:hypothetical protein
MRQGLRLAKQDKGRDDPYGGGAEIYDSDGRHIGWCAYPKLNGSHHARRYHESRRRDEHAHVLPDAAKQVDKDLGPSKDELTLEQFKPEFTRNAKTPTVLPGSRTLISRSRSRKTRFKTTYSNRKSANGWVLIGRRVAATATTVASLSG